MSMQTVKARFRHVFEVTRDVDIDVDEVRAWADDRYGRGTGYDFGLAIAVWIDRQEVDYVADIFSDWRTNKPLPTDFELRCTEVEDVEFEEEDDA